MEKVLIGIQARSTSKRLPKKVFELIGGKPLLQHVIDACENAANHINQHSRKKQVEVEVCLLIPDGDPIRRQFRRNRCFEGPEHDVLTRYYQAALRFEADYIVRVTGDCPLIPSPIVSKTINTIILNDYDYASNVYEGVRGYQDGLDCEAFTFDALELAFEQAKTKEDREHVTTWMRENISKLGHVVPWVHNLNGPKLSVDTEDDLERVREVYDLSSQAIEMAEKLHGKRSLHRF